MFDKEKLPKLLLTIAVVLLLACSFLYFGERTKRISLQRKLEEVNMKLSSTQKALDSANKEAQRLEADLRNTTGELNNQKEINKEVMKQLDQTRDELQKQVYQKLDLQQRLNKAKEERKNIQDELSKIDTVKSDLEAKIRDLEEKEAPAKSNIELGQIVVAAQRTKPAQPLNGTVLVVNKDYSFAVINLGSKNGLASNDTIAVYDKDKFIGDVKVEKLQESMAAVNFLSPRLKDKLVPEKDYIFKPK